MLISIAAGLQIRLSGELEQQIRLSGGGTANIRQRLRYSKPKYLSLGGRKGGEGNIYIKDE